ncbi:hypothetical protein IW261DRAFT_119986 [Armillaria novae-zelandiae]|uniref:Uncharacterized protein n=1 Tax=Armillaria novae-zelandiae TaxID=153914 RepID=A0AA39P9P8_9AGAR|nr:hypothetical protein IW261DRAFT_119986 [Armillaria novae-zelandiae]
MCSKHHSRHQCIISPVISPVVSSLPHRFHFHHNRRYAPPVKDHNLRRLVASSHICRAVLCLISDCIFVSYVISWNILCKNRTHHNPNLFFVILVCFPFNLFGYFLCFRK